MMAGIGVNVFAEEKEFVLNSEMTQEELVQGETKIGDTIYGRTLYGDANAPLKNRASCPNYAKSEENWLVFYTGYIQFVPAYRTSLTDGYGLVGGRNVRRAWIDYVYGPNKISVTEGGKQYTAEAASINDTQVYSVTAHAVDDLFTWGEEGRTYFSRGWLYFS